MLNRPRRFPAALVCCSLLVAFAQAGESGPRPIGAGGFPVSFTHASAWFGHRADATQKVVTLLVYFEGRAGWHNERTSFKWDVKESPARIEMTVGRTEIRVRYWPETADVEIQGAKHKLSDSNVFLVERTDGADTVVKPLGLHDLSFAGAENPAVTLLRRNAEVWSALTGRPVREHSATQRLTIQMEIVAMDEEGIRLLATGDAAHERKACELFREATKKGYWGAQYRLGYCYESGHGVEQNYSTANEWYEKAANQGHVDAQYKLGHSYRVGRGVQIDLAKSLHWYKKAGENGDSEALHNLGAMYAAGQGANANAKEAYNWFLKAALHGETSSQFEVARRLRAGDGSERDLVSPYGWLLVLRAQEKSFAAEEWNVVKAAISSVEGQLDCSAIVSAEGLARGWLTMIAKHEMERLGRNQ
jgi:TPR repeat protein